MTIFEAIKHCKDRAEKCDKCGEEHRQLREWMEELLQYREIGTIEECREVVRTTRRCLCDAQKWCFLRFQQNI